MKLPTSVKIYLGIIITIGSILLVFSAINSDIHTDKTIWAGVIFFILLGAMAESLPVRIEGDNLVTVSDTVSIAAILLFDAPTAVLVRFLGAILAVRRSQNRYTHLFNTPIYKSLFNGFCRGITVFLAWQAYQFLDGMAPKPAIMNFGLLGVLGLVAVYFAVDQILFAILFSFLSKTSFIHEINKKLWAIKQLLALTPLGVIFAGLYSWQGILPVIFLVGPFLFTRQSIEQAHRRLEKQKKIEEELRSSEEKFSKAFHASPMAIIIQRASDLKYVDINEGFTRITGYSREEALEHSINELNLYPDKEISARMSKQFREQGFLRDFEFPFRRKNGEIGYGLVWGEPIEINGEAMYIAGTIDITERKKFEILQSEQTQEIKTLYKALSEIAGKPDNLKTLTKRIAEIAANDFHAYKSSVWLLSDDHSQVARKAHSGTETSEHEDVIPMNATSLITTSIKTRETIYTPDIRTDPRYFSGDESTLSEFVVPLQAYGEVIGVINMESPKVDDFSERTRRLVSAFAQNATLALQNTNLLDSLEKSLLNLKETQAQIDFFLEHTAEGVYRIDYDPPIPTSLPIEEQFKLSVEHGKIGECNTAFANMYGLAAREEMLGKPYVEFYGEDGYEANKDGNLAFYRQGYKIDDFETQELNIHGEKVYFANNVVGIIRDGYFVSTWGTQRDITPLKKALTKLEKLNQELEKNLAELKESQARINFFLEHTAEGVYRVDYDPPIPIHLPFEEQYKLSRERGKFGECNLAIVRMYGYSSREEMLEAPYYLENEGYEASLEANLEFYRRGYRTDDYETEEYTPAGEKAYFLNNAVGIIRDGYFMSIWGTQRDITPLKKALAELENRNAELERYTYTLSHELKTPIVTIRGFQGFLKNNMEAGNVERAKADLARIGHAADKMYKMISELLELSRIGRIINPPEDVPFEEIVQAGLNNAEASINEHNVQVHVQSGMPIVHADLTRLIEVIQNLVENAVKYIGDQPNPQITIGVRSEKDKHVFFVSDNGMGIDPEYHERVFNIFEKLNPQSPGTGIGLAIVKRIIEMHGGRIWIESEGIGKGSTFCFTLPTTKL